MDCRVINKEPWIKLEPSVAVIPNVPNVAETTLRVFLKRHAGGFPTSEAIRSYEQDTGKKFKNSDSGINGVILRPDGLLVINFYDSAAAYGGGSALVGCMSMAVRYTLKQFQTIKDI